MAAIDIYKRKMFGDLTPNEYQELVDYSKSFGGIPSLNVNRGVTTEDVVNATSPLSQPIGPGATNAVAAFNDFLAGILSNKATRVASEKEKLLEQNQEAIARVDKALVPEDESKYFMEVDGKLIDTRLIGSEGNPSGVVVPKDKLENKLKDNFQVVGDKLIDLTQIGSEDNPTGVIIDKDPDVEKLKDQFMILNNSLVDLKGETGPKVVIEDIEQEKLSDKYKVVGNTIIDLSKLDSSNPDSIEDAIAYKGEDLSGTKEERFLTEKVELEIKKQNDPANFTQADDLRLKEITKFLNKRDYPTPAEETWAPIQNELVIKSIDDQALLNKINETQQIIEKKGIVTGPYTPALTFVQELLEPVGVKLDGFLNTFGLDLLNDPTDSALIDSAAKQFGIAASEGLQGSISNTELEALFNTTIRLGAPEEFNRQFLNGFKYLVQKKVAAGEIAAESNTLVDWYAGMKNWMDKNPAPSFMRDIYEFESLEDLRLDLNLNNPQDKES